MKRARQESIPDKIQRYKGVILVVSIPLLLISFVLFLMPRSPAAPKLMTTEDMSTVAVGRKTVPGGLGPRSYAVIFDAGSSGSRVHVYCFDKNLDLVHIGKELELFVQKKPGLSSYAEDPKEAANSLVSLLEQAESAVPVELRQSTPVRVGATAGLRTLGDETAEEILQAVRDLLRDKSSLKSQPDWVTVLDGTQEGAYQWVTINYLLGRLGKKYSKTVGVVDLGGGSVQMAYAISESDAAKSPRTSDGEEKYVKELLLKGTKYYLYVHSYLHYGLLAARAEILKVAEGSSSCVLNGYHGTYKYGGGEFPANGLPSGASFAECRSDVVKALRVDEPACTHMKCTFAGVWNGGGGDGQKNLFVASFFFDRAAEMQTIPTDKPIELLIDGLGPWQEITLVKKVQYGDALVEAAWPLGSAIEVASLT
ncbi:uncharacterized protein A4U43_C07F7770 [Asparagus officinalis]|uniref:Apyrase n=1 Tax=Asparagus officinalis TaxID=4686 RepID=A0A5P1EA70_ASPOF|nr:uncharacterized protein A4U43_C07F7770 [Asparagus officinalis]